jgi:hypothetical protein
VIAWAALVRLADWARQRLTTLNAGGSPCPVESAPVRPPAPTGSHSPTAALDLADAPPGAAATDPAGTPPVDCRTGRVTTRRQGGGQ